jgi:hypothetical protein
MILSTKLSDPDTILSSETAGEEATEPHTTISGLKPNNFIETGDK